MLNALIVVNSKNKKTHFYNHLADVCQALSRKNYSIKISFTKKPNDISNILADVEQIDLIVVAGGDGTMNEVVNALSKTEHKVKIMYFPTGTVNDFGTSLKIPHNFKKQLQLLNKHTTMMVDSGKVNEYYFNYICAFGAFTRASYTTPHWEKNKYGKLAYYRHLIDEIPALSKSYELDIDVDGEKINGNFSYALIINSTSVAGFRHFLKNDSMNDGYFNLLLVTKANAKVFKKAIKYLIKGMSDNIDDDHYILRKFKKLTINTDDKISWTIDGEKGPVGSIEVEVIKHNLEIICP
ncbi:diacylglycerol kinase (ATP) [Bacilli bacterium PM5-9]|nr:diacylglycerol kinase (ATP) [Bacilli bacterium PM5-9]